MEQNIVSVGYNPEFQPEIETITKSLLAQYDILKKIDGTRISPGSGGGYTELKAQVEALEKANRALGESNAKLAQSLADLKKKRDENTNSDKEGAKAAREKEKADKDATRAAKERAAQMERDKKIAAQAADEYFNLNKALVDAEKRYKNLALTQGFSNEQTKIALKEALAIRGVLNKVDAELGNYQRNVGNYKSGFSGLSNSFQQIIREAPSAAVSLNTFFLGISNNLPMFFDEIAKIKRIQAESLVVAKQAAAAARIEAEARALQSGATQKTAVAEGLLAEKTALANAQTTKAPSLWKQLGSAVFSFNTLLTVGVLALTLFGGKLVDWISNLGGAKKAVLDFNETIKSLSKYQNDFAESFGKELVHLQVLKGVIEDVNKPMNVRLQAVKDIQKEFPEYFKGLTTEAILAGKIGDAYNRATEAIIQKSKASSATKVVEEIYGEINKLEIISLNNTKAHQSEYAKLVKKTQEEIGKTIAFTSKFTTKTDIEDGKKYVKAVQEVSDALLKTKQDEFDKSQKLLNKEISDRKIKAKQFIDIAIGNTVFDPSKEEKAKKEKTAKEQKDISDKTAEDILRINYEMNKRLFEMDLADAKERVDNDKSTYRNRLIALAEYMAIKVKLSDIDRQYEIDQEALKYAEIEKNLKAQKPEEVKGGQKAINAQLAKEEQAHFLRLLNIESKYFEERRKLGAQYLADAKKMDEDREGKLKSDLDKDIARQKRNIDEKRAMLDAFDKENDVKWKKKTAKEIAQQKFIEENKYNFTKEFTNKAIDLVQTLVDAGYTRQQNAIQKLIDANNRYESAELERIENTTVSEQEKAAMVIQLNAQTAEKNKQLEDDQKQARIKQAEFDKAIALVKITLNTAIAATNAATTGDPYTAALRAGIVIALGAAEFAIAAATPIPTYAEGGVHPGGYAIWAEAGVPEKVKEPGKAPYISYQPTMGILPAGTVLTPITDMVNQSMYDSMMKSWVEPYLTSQIDNKLGEIKEAIIEQGWQTQQAIRNQRKGNVSVYLNGNFGAYLQKAVRE